MKIHFNPLNFFKSPSKDSLIKKESILDKINPFQFFFGKVKTNKDLVVHSQEFDKVNELTRTLADFTMRNLSPETVETVKELYANFGRMIEMYDLDEKDLDFLLQATPHARCTFAKKYTPQKKERLHKLKLYKESMLAAKEGKYPTNFAHKADRYIADLESFMTAIGYSCLYGDIKENPSLGPSWEHKKGAPSTKLVAFIEAMKSGEYLMPAIGDGSAYGFPSRWKEDSLNDLNLKEVKKVKLKPKLKKDKQDKSLETIFHNQTKHLHIKIAKGYQTPLFSHKPKAGLGERYFKFSSYVAKAMKNNIAMRSHVSGSAPLTLSAMEYINTQGGKKALNEKRLNTLAGLLIASYELGDYHSPAETAAGIVHFHQNYKNERIYVNNIKNVEDQYLEDITAKNYLGIAVGYLNQIVSNDKLEDFNEISTKVLEKVKDTKQSHLPPNNQETKSENIFKRIFRSL